MSHTKQQDFQNGFAAVQIPSINMMQYPLYASYPYINGYPCYEYNNYFGSGYSFGQTYGNYYGYQPWMAQQGNHRMQHGNSGAENHTALMTTNGYYPDFQQMSSKYVYPQCNLYQYPWRNSPYALTNWFNPQHTYNHMAPWTSYYNHNKWAPMRMNFNTGMYYSWPMMNYYPNQMMYPNYLCTSPAYWGVQQTIEMPPSEPKQKMTAQHTSESRTLNVTSSDVIRDFNLPPAVAKKTRSDIPRPSVDYSDMKESEKSKDDMELPYLFRVSDTSIKQIASSRSFGPSMVYNTDSDNKPLSAHW